MGVKQNRFPIDDRTLYWKDLFYDLDSGIDNCSEHSFNMRRGQTSGSGHFKPTYEAPQILLKQLLLHLPT